MGLQVSDAPEENEKLNKIFKRIAQVLSVPLWIVLVAMIHDDTYTIQLAVVLLICGLVHAVFIVPIVWNVANAIRKWVKPDMLISDGARGAVMDKLFWLLGPQSLAALVSTVILFLACFLVLGSIMTKASSNKVVDVPVARDVKVAPQNAVEVGGAKEEKSTEPSQQDVKNENPERVEKKPEEGN